LLTYAYVQKRARQMVDVTRRRLMPPWAPLPNYCRFNHDLSLTANESDMIAQWVDEGMLPGDPSQLAAPREFPEGWTQGEPDHGSHHGRTFRTSRGQSRRLSEIRIANAGREHDLRPRLRIRSGQPQRRPSERLFVSPGSRDEMAETIFQI
jgi:hypothetical protein